MEGTRFRLDLKLQNLAMISIAEKVWDSFRNKNKIKINFSRPDWKYPDENWREISKLVVKYANSINLPPSLSVLLKKTILFIGQKIYDWIAYVTKILELDLIFTERIYFNFGAVDEIKIFDLYWGDLMAADDVIYRSYYFRHSPLFSVACIYGRERFVNERKNEMLDELSKFYPEINTGDEVYNIMSFSICMTKQESIFENVGSPQRLFELCLEAGFSKAARFYWEKLDEVEKVSNLTDFAKKCWRKHYESSYIMEKYCENLLFLINEMGEKERYIFFTNYADEIIRLFLPLWPYQELIVDMNLLKYDWNIQSSRLRDLAIFVMWYMCIMNRWEFSLDNELVFQIIQKSWGNIPVQRDGVEVYCLVKYGFLELIKIGKFDFLNEIIEKVLNFIPEPKDLLKEYILNSDFVQELMEKDESFGLLDQFLDWLTESKAERAILKNEINTISYYRDLTELPRYQFELADKFLKWKLESDGEVKSFKEAMKSYNLVMVDELKYVRIKSGDLNWLRPGDSLATHPDEDPINNTEGLTFLKFEEATELNRGVVLGIKSYCSGVNDDFLGPDDLDAERWNVHYVGTKVGDFIVFNVLGFWSCTRQSYFHIESIVNLSNGFIKFYYETDEEVLNFKKTKLHVLVTENRMEYLLNLLKGHMVFPENFLDDFCEFCLMPSEKIEKIKFQHRSDDVEKFLDTYLIEQPSFQLVHIYLNWLFGDVKKKEVCKKFLNSSNKGALLCIYYLKLYGEYSPLNCRDLEICRWLDLIDDMEKLKNDVCALYENTPEWFPGLLKRSTNLASWPVGHGW